MPIMNKNILNKLFFILLMLMCSNVFADPFRDAVPGEDRVQFMDLVKTLHNNQAKVDCSNKLFISKNSPRSLMGWSNRYHNDVVLAYGYQKGENNTGAITASNGGSACYKTIKYRGAAVCLKPNNEDYLNKLMETVNLCYQMAFE